MNFDFEQELKNALQRKEPAKGFTERVIRQVTPQPQRKSLFPGRSAGRGWASLAVAASLFAGVFGVIRYEEYRKGERAKEQLMLALRITAKTLDTVERKLRQ